MIDFQKILERAIHEALRARDEVRLRTLRMLASSLHNRLIEKRSRGAGGLAEEDYSAAVRSEVKKRQEAIREFSAGGRRDLADREAEEMEILAAYLPAEMPDEELERIVADTVASAGAPTKKDFGRIMGLVMKRVGQAASGERAARIVQKILQTDAA